MCSGNNRGQHSWKSVSCTWVDFSLQWGLKHISRVNCPYFLLVLNSFLFLQKRKYFLYKLFFSLDRFERVTKQLCLYEVLVYRSTYLRSPLCLLEFLAIFTHQITSWLAENPWCCNDLDKRSNFLPLCSLAKVAIPVPTKEDFLHWDMFRILLGRSWSGQGVGKGYVGIHIYRSVGCTFVLEQLEVDGS